MSNKLRKRTEGFTIIEVMIVLAIAGIIMLIVFLAVPALQRNSRNNQRRSDAAHLAGLINEYAANHAGALPTGYGTGAGQVDITNERWSIVSVPTQIVAANNPWGTPTTLVVNTGQDCNPATNTLVAGSARTFSITYQVETSSTNQNSCLNG